MITQLSYFANVVLSSFYFDINKDRLYAAHEQGLERRRVLTVLDQVLPFFYILTCSYLTRLFLDVGFDDHDQGSRASSTSSR